MSSVVFSGMHIFVIVLNLAIVVFGGYLAINFLRGKMRNKIDSHVGNDEANSELSFGTILKKARCKKNMTQEYVAEQLGVSRQAVSKWESEVTSPNTSNIVALADLYDVSVELLLERATKKVDR